MGEDFSKTSIVGKIMNNNQHKYCKLGGFYFLDWEILVLVLLDDSFNILLLKESGTNK